MDLDGGDGPGFGFTTESTEYPASLAPNAQYMTPQYMEPRAGPVSVQNHQQPFNGCGFAPPPDPSAEAQHYQPHTNDYGYARPPAPFAGGNSLQARLILEPPSLQVPGHLQDLCAAYVASYDNYAIPNSSQMGSAQALALALLQQYYPESEGYLVQPSALGPIAKHGLNFILKANDGSDPNFIALPSKKDSKKGKNRKPSKAQQKLEYVRQFDHNISFAMSVRWHMIEPEDIAGFEVMKKVTAAEGEDKEDEYLPYTYLAIIIDDLRTFPSLAENNDVHRGDILTDVLCRSQHIRVGHGILLFGTRLEMYHFDNGAATSPDTHNAIGVEEPYVALCKDADDRDLAVNLRTTGLHTVDRLFMEIAANGVEYLDVGADAGGQEGVTSDQEVDPADGEQEEVTMSGMTIPNRDVA
jgi:hypothetical protein